MSTDYVNQYKNINFRKYPERYRIGRGEQGVLMAEPYKSEILPYWKFATPATAEASAKKIHKLFIDYGKKDDFVGMDMARKFLQMGFTRARRYANHKSGRKYNLDGTVKPQEADWKTSEKAQSAQIFYEYYNKARANPHYELLKKRHKELYGSA